MGVYGWKRKRKVGMKWKTGAKVRKKGTRQWKALYTDAAGRKYIRQGVLGQMIPVNTRKYEYKKRR